MRYQPTSFHDAFMTQAYSPLVELVKTETAQVVTKGLRSVGIVGSFILNKRDYHKNEGNRLRESEHRRTSQRRRELAAARGDDSRRVRAAGARDEGGDARRKQP